MEVEIDETVEVAEGMKISIRRYLGKYEFVVLMYAVNAKECRYVLNAHTQLQQRNSGL